jgi:hypothetical protein
MPSATRTIAIDRPPEDVFAFFSDPANDRRWRGHVKEIAAEGAPGIGRRIHQVVDGPGGRGIAADIEVTAYDSPSRNCGSRSPSSRNSTVRRVGPPTDPPRFAVQAPPLHSG